MEHPYLFRGNLGSFIIMDDHGAPPIQRPLSLAEQRRVEELYALYLPQLKEHAQWLDRHNWEDLVQRTLARIVTYRPDLPEPPKTLPYLYAILRNEMLTELKQRDRSGRPGQADEISEAIDNITHKEWCSMAPAEDRILVLQARAAWKAKCTTEQWAVVELTFFEDRNDEDVARALNLSVETVKARLRSAHKHLANLAKRFRSSGSLAVVFAVLLMRSRARAAGSLPGTNPSSRGSRARTPARFRTVVRARRRKRNHLESAQRDLLPDPGRPRGLRIQPRTPVRWLVPRLHRLAAFARLGWHVLRHTFASTLARRGAPLQAIKDLLGHQTITMTLRYAHLMPSSLANVVALLEPTPVGHGNGRATGPSKPLTHPVSPIFVISEFPLNQAKTPRVDAVLSPGSP